MKPVLICGGVGTKMWPLSRGKFPKHFLPLFNGRSLFQINYEVLRKKFSPDEIYVETTQQQVNLVRKQAPEIPSQNYFIEPEMRNHGPATGFMAAKLFMFDPDEPFILVQVDVLREPGEKFLEMIDQCESLIKKEGKLVSGGIKPDYAIMGVDYLAVKKRVGKTGEIKIHQMDEWLGRDSKEKVEKHLKGKSVFAHANHYAWTPRLMLEAYKRRAPDWYSALQKMMRVFGTDKEEGVVKKEYAMMEKAPAERVTKFELENGYLVELPFSWVDFGTWESLARYQKAKRGRGPGKNLLEIDSNNCFVYHPKNKFIATIGVDNLVIIDTSDALLICRKDKTGRVGEIVEHLRQKGENRLL